MTEKHYVSRYLNIIDLDDPKISLLFNGVNGCMDEIPRELGDILSSRDHSRIARLSPANRKFLAQRGHITTFTPEAEMARFKEFVACLHNKKSTSSPPVELFCL
ncbi:MAG: hypothetical protein WCK75_09885 [Elusimicrobiota bacterium]